MSKIKRNERIGAIVKILADAPNKTFTLSYFTEMFEAAKSTVSEDLVIVKKLMEKLEIGKVITIPGAAGGVKYLPFMGKKEKLALLDELCQEIMDHEREIPGGFLYLLDVLYNPKYVSKLGEIFAEKFMAEAIDYVVTVETKGIPIALMTARSLNVPLVIVRNENKVTEGSTVSINYVSGTTGKLGTMYAPKRAMKRGSNVLIIDDFMRGGGTAKGLVDLVKEFDSFVKGVGVLFETVTPEKKMIDNYFALLRMDDTNREEAVQITPLL